MAKTSVAQKFTDIEYLSKKEVADQIGAGTADVMWRQVSEYREKYKFPLDIKRFDHIPFCMVLTPFTMGIPNSSERLMVKFASLYERYKNKQDISETKSLDKFNLDVISEDLYMMAVTKELGVSTRDIEVMLDKNSMHLKDSEIYAYYDAHKYLVENPSVNFDKNLFREIYSRLTRTSIEDNGVIYRTHNNYLNAANSDSIEELMHALFEFYNSGYELSPFIAAAVVYVYIMYVMPFNSHNEEMAVLLYMKVLADAGYGQASYYLSIGEFVMQKQADFAQQFDEVRKSGDMTYGIIFLSRIAYDAIDWRYQTLAKLQEPEPSYGNVRVIEKIVEKVVEKEVPIFIEKGASLNKKEEPKVEVKLTPIEPKKPINDKKSKFEFETDPFLMFEDKSEEEVKEEPKEIVSFTKLEEKPLEGEEKIEEVGKEVTANFEFNVTQESYPNEFTDAKKDTEEIKEPLKEEKIEEIKPLVDVPIIETRPKIAPKANVTHSKIKINTAELEGLEETEYARRLVEMHPLLKYHQALFFATHRALGRYYSISQFKEFNDCAYETARTSMDFLTSIGLYRKEQVKNKFVYTPEENGENS